ncbi:hypothetical protein AYI70_g560 [Smittium culicis]|uniref:Uncharacterized protein n=1 Tax=Smittium culicis TaxID=133412 RepID=A0A1R1YG93_9FUNG|nr:hypothetical protein AYI70_g560 [Smittium culicis]
MTNEKPIKRARNTFSDVLKGNLPHGTPKPIIIKKNEPKKIKSIFRYDQKIDMSQYRALSLSLRKFFLGRANRIRESIKFYFLSTIHFFLRPD